MITIIKKEGKFTNSEKGLTITLPTYQYDFELYTIALTVILGKQNMDKYNELYDNPSACAQCESSWLKSNGEIILFFNSTRPKASTIAHECVHTCDHILESIGHKHPNKSNEINAYLVGHLVDVVMAVLKSNRKNNGENND